MEVKDEVKERLSLEDVIGEYLELKRSGRNYKAISPFTNERTASFMVSPDKQIWHDFSSNKGGDVFTFVMEMEGIDFREALEILARKAGVELSDYSGQTKSSTQAKNRLYEELELASNYYHATLIKNSKALDYVVKNRGYGKEIIKKFKIGFAPSKGTALLEFLTKRGYSIDEIKKAGLITQKGNRPSDMFRSRIMIPLHDSQGRVVGFTARVLDNSLPKYINTPQTMIYDKGRQVFGLHLAKDAIRKENFVVVVEGNLDVIASHKAGVENVVASAGTAMTRDHLVQLGRLTEDVRLAFDKDDAGLAATERVIPVAQEVGVKLSIIDIPGAKDPDELITKDPKAWGQTIRKSKYVIDWLIDSYTQKYDIKTSPGKKAMSDVVLKLLSSLQDPIEKEHYINKLAQILETDPKTIVSKLDSFKNKKIYKRPKIKPETGKVKIDMSASYQDQILGMAMLYPDLREILDRTKEDFYKSSHRKELFNKILNSGDQILTDKSKELNIDENYVKIVIFKTEELYDGWSSSDRMIEAIGLVQRLEREFNLKMQKELSAQIKEAEEAGDEARVQKLLEKFQQLIKE